MIGRHIFISGKIEYMYSQKTWFMYLSNVYFSCFIDQLITLPSLSFLMWFHNHSFLRIIFQTIFKNQTVGTFYENINIEIRLKNTIIFKGEMSLQKTFIHNLLLEIDSFWSL